MPLKFRFALIPFVATVLLMALGVALGRWQDRRADTKLAAQAVLAQRAQEAPLVLDAGHTAPAQDFRRVQLTGEFLAAWPVYLDNRPHENRAGLYVLMPFKIRGSDQYVLVARGWLARDAQVRDRVKAFPTPTGIVSIEGTARTNMGHVMELGPAPVLTPGAFVQNMDAARFGAATKLPMLPFVLAQSSDTGDGLARDWPAPNLDVGKHQGYAFQWYALAVMAFCYFIFNGFRRGSK